MKKILIVTLSVSIVLIGFSVLSVAEEKERRVGDWFVLEEKDPLTDELKVFIYLPSNRAKEDRSIVRALYIRRRQEGSKELFIYWQDIERLATNKIIYRFDEGEVEETEWAPGGGGKGKGSSLFFPEGKELKSFVERLIKAEEFIVGAYPQGRTRITDTFELEGLGKALSPYLEEFGWEDLSKTIKEEMEETEEW